MAKLLRLIGGLVGIIILVPAVVLGIFFATFDFNAFKTQVMQQVSTALGRDVAVNGPIGVDFKDGLVLTLKDINVGNPKSFTEKDFAKIGSLYVSVNWRALMDKSVEVKRVAVADADIHLVTNSAGENNWEFKLPKAEPGAPENSPANAPKEKVEKALEKATDKNSVPNKDEFRIEKVDIGSVELENVKLQQLDVRSGKKQDVQLEKATVKAPAEGALSVQARGNYNAQGFDVDLNAPKGWKELADGTLTPVELKAKYAGESYDVKAHFSQKPKLIEVKNLQTVYKGAEFTGNLNIRTDTNVPMVTGNLASTSLDLRGFLKQAALMPPLLAQSLVMQYRTPLAIPIAAGAAKPADLSALKAANADLQISFAKLILPEGQVLDDVKTHLVLNGGRLRLDPLTLNLLGVPYQGVVEITPDSATHLTLKASGIDFEALAKAFNTTSPLSAKGDLNMDITGRGLDAEAFKRTLGGRIQLTLGQGGVDLGSGGTAATNLIRMLYPKTAFSQKQTINCADIRLTAENGVLKTNGFLIDSAAAALIADGTIDLPRDNANLLFTYAVKDEAMASIVNVPMRATGPLANMSFSPEEKALLQKASGILTGRSAGSSGVPKVEPAAGGINPCVATLNNPNPPMLQQQKPQDAAKEAVQKATDTYKGVRDQVKGLLGKGSAPAAPADPDAPAAPTENKPADTINKLKGLFGR
jgi:uncharacterized protein involved in outer membrane biogenesis